MPRPPRHHRQPRVIFNIDAPKIIANIFGPIITVGLIVLICWLVIA